MSAAITFSGVPHESLTVGGLRKPLQAPPISLSRYRLIGECCQPTALSQAHFGDASTAKGFSDGKACLIFRCVTIVEQKHACFFSTIVELKHACFLVLHTSHSLLVLCQAVAALRKTMMVPEKQEVHLYPGAAHTFMSWHEQTAQVHCE